MIDRKTELLAPAGDMERLEMALHYGADAVYLAGKRFGMRASAGNFPWKSLPSPAQKRTKGCGGPPYLQYLAA